MAAFDIADKFSLDNVIQGLRRLVTQSPELYHGHEIVVPSLAIALKHSSYFTKEEQANFFSLTCRNIAVPPAEYLRFLPWTFIEKIMAGREKMKDVSTKLITAGGTTFRSLDLNHGWAAFLEPIFPGLAWDKASFTMPHAVG